MVFRNYKHILLSSCLLAFHSSYTLCMHSWLLSHHLLTSLTMITGDWHTLELTQSFWQKLLEQDDWKLSFQSWVTSPAHTAFQMLCLKKNLILYLWASSRLIHLSILESVQLFILLWHASTCPYPIALWDSKNVPLAYSVWTKRCKTIAPLHIFFYS